MQPTCSTLFVLFLIIDLARSSIKIGTPAPSFTATALLPNKEIKDISLSDFKGQWVVLFFYPLDFTFVCPTEIIAFSDRSDEFTNINTAVLGASIDSVFTHLAWTKVSRNKGGLGDMKIPLISDLTHTMSKNYGVFMDDAGHSLRGLFIIDPSQNLRQITMNDLPVGRSVDETLRLVQAFQYVEEHGEVCPQGWKPGSDTIIPNPVDKVKYFERANSEL